jgi:hypothetical protein
MGGGGNVNATDWGKSKRELQEPCEYCTDGVEGEALIFEDDVELFLDYGCLKVHGIDSDLFSLKVGIKVNYCPMCGRKLSES